MLLFIFIVLLIVQIKSCPLTDEYLSRCHCGILTNGESYIKCNEYSLNEIPKFKRSFSYDELILTNNNIKYLTSTSFDNIKTIKRINFYGNSLSYIDKNLLRLLGNYLEELILTGDTKINSLEFLTLYPLKKLRLIKLNKFNLSQINIENIFINMTKLEIIYLNSCQLNSIPIIKHIKILNIEKNFIHNHLILSTYYYHLNLANNYITSIILYKNPNLISLNISKNFLKKFSIKKNFNNNLQILDLSSNQLKFFNKTIFKQNLTYLNLNNNYFENLTKFMPYVKFFNITFTYDYYLYIQWNINDYKNLIYYLQISIEQPYRISEYILSNQTQAIILNNILLNHYYHICLILIHKYSRDKYCRNFLTNNPIIKKILYNNNDIIFNNDQIKSTKLNDNHLYLLLIALCIGCLLTFILLLTCSYLCYQIYNYKKLHQQPLYEKCSQNIHCQHNQIIYNSENISNSTDCTHIDTSLSTATTTNNFKHIYQTIDSQDYSSLKRKHYQLFELWNKSIKQKR